MLKKVIACILVVSISLGMCNYAALADDSVEIPAEEVLVQEEAVEDISIEVELPEEGVFEEANFEDEVIEEDILSEYESSGDETAEDVFFENESEDELHSLAMSGSCGENVIWSLTELLNGTYKLSLSGNGATDYYLGDSVTNSTRVHAPWYDYRTQITELEIGEGITYLGADLFYRLSAITSVIIPDSVTAIGSSFEYCSSLKTVVLNEGLQTIGAYCFQGCSDLQEIVIPSTVIRVGYGAFRECTGLTYATILCSKASFEGAVFYKDSHLYSVSVPSIEAWCGNSFAGQYQNGTSPMLYAKKLIVNGVEQRNLVVPEGVTSIPIAAFYDCGIETVVLPSTLQTIGVKAFASNPIQEIIIPDQVQSIGAEAFDRCNQLTHIEVPFVGYQRGTTTLDTGDRLFSYIFTVNGNIPASLTKVVITDDTKIYDGAFVKCSSITDLTISGSVTEIQGNALNGCTALERLTIPFVGTKRDNTGKDALFGSVFLNLSSTSTRDDDTRQYASNTGTAYRFVIPSTLTEVIITDETTLSFGAFSNCSNLKTIQINEGISVLGDKVFMGCSSLTELTIPASVTTLGSDLLQGCDKVEMIHLEGGGMNLGEAIFSETEADIFYYEKYKNVWTPARRENAGVNANWIGIDGVNTVRIKNYPSKLTYNMGDEFQPDGGVVQVLYYSGRIEEYSFEDLTISGYDAWKNGVQNLKIHWEEYTVSFSITMNRVIEKVEIISKPSKTSYGVGQQLELDGGILRATYTDGFTENVSITMGMIRSFSSVTVGDQVITVVYKGMSDNFVISIADVGSIRMESNPDKTNFEYGQNIQCNGGKILITYMNGVTETKDITASMLSGYNPHSPGTQKITVTYRGASTSFSVFVRYISTISLSSKPKDSYILNEELEVTGGVVTVFYNDGSEMELPLTLEMVTGFDPSLRGTQVLTVTYADDFTTTLQVTVFGIDHIEVETYPQKRYVLNEPLNLADGMVALIYENGYTETIPMTEEMVTGFNNKETGDCTLTVSYQEYTTTYTVLVAGEIGITVDSSGVNQYYSLGEEISQEVLIISLHFSDGVIELVDASEVSMTGYDPQVDGSQRVSVEYHGFTASFDVFVLAVESIEMASLPTSVDYPCGSTVNVEGGKIRVYYNNGESTEMDLRADMLGEYDSTIPTNQTIIVCYEGSKTTFEVSFRTVGDAVVTADAITYSSPKIDTNKVGSVKEGDRVTVTDIEGDFYLLSNGQYVQMRYVYVLGTPEPNTNDKIGRGTTTMKTTIYVEPSTDSASVGSVGVGSEKNLYAQSGNWYQIYSGGRYVWVHASAFNFTQASTTTRLTTAIVTATTTIYVGPGLHFQSAGTVNEGRTVNVYEIRDGWFKIYSGGKYGWVKENYVFDKSLGLPTAADEIGQGTTTKSVTIYAEPNSSSAALGTVGEGKVRNLYRQSGNWYQIYTGGMYAWVRCDGFDYTSAISNASMMQRTILTDSVMYYGPGYEYVSPGTLTKGTVVNVYKEVEGWYLVYKTGKYLWLHSDFLGNAMNIVFNRNGGKGTMDKQVILTGSSARLDANTYTRTGYQFNGWNTAANGYGQSYANKQTVQSTTDMSQKSLTLYAQWKENSYTIHFNSNGGTGTVSDITALYTKTVKLAVTGFTNSGLELKGWNTKADGSGTSYALGASVKSLTATNGGTVTLYAQWGFAGPCTIKEIKSTSTSAVKVQIEEIKGVSGYEVYRSLTLAGNFTLLGTTENLYFEDKGLTSGATYYYKVRAFINVGSKTIYSEYSPIVQKKVATKPSVIANVGGYIPPEEEYSRLFLLWVKNEGTSTMTIDLSASYYAMRRGSAHPACVSLSSAYQVLYGKPVELAPGESKLLVVALKYECFLNPNGYLDWGFIYEDVEYFVRTYLDPSSYGY